MPGSTPSCCRCCTTASARASDRCQFDGKFPLGSTGSLSVWPSTRMIFPFTSLSALATLSSAAWPSLPSSAEPEAKRILSFIFTVILPLSSESSILPSEISFFRLWARFSYSEDFFSSSAFASASCLESLASSSYLPCRSRASSSFLVTFAWSSSFCCLRPSLSVSNCLTLASAAVARSSAVFAFAPFSSASCCAAISCSLGTRHPHTSAPTATATTLRITRSPWPEPEWLRSQLTYNTGRWVGQRHVSHVCRCLTPRSALWSPRQHVRDRRHRGSRAHRAREEEGQPGRYPSDGPGRARPQGRAPPHRHRPALRRGRGDGLRLPGRRAGAEHRPRRGARGGPAHRDLRQHGEPLLRLRPAGGELRRHAGDVRAGGDRHRRRGGGDEPGPHGIGRRRPGRGPRVPGAAGALPQPRPAGALRGADLRAVEALPRPAG